MSNQTPTPSQNKPKEKRRKLSRPAVAIKHRKVLDNLSENGGNLSKAIRDTGLYSQSVADSPGKITDSKTWKELVEERLSDEKLSDAHAALLKSASLDHMTFALGPRTLSDKQDWIDKKRIEAFAAGKDPNSVGTDILCDDDIKEMLLEVNCTVRRIVHRESGRDVYFWSPDNRARKDALELAYKIKGKINPEPGGDNRGNTYNFLFAADTQSEIKAFEEKLKAKLLGHVGENQALSPGNGSLEEGSGSDASADTK